MSSLADKIEQYIKILIDRSSSGSIEIQRLELAETFACAPSQITYVISTRFNPQFGFWVESKRGGSGYVRVSRIPTPSAEWLSPADARLVLQQLLADERITSREYFLLQVVIDSLGSSELPAVEPIIGRLLQAVARLL